VPACNGLGRLLGYLAAWHPGCLGGGQSVREAAGAAHQVRSSSANSSYPSHITTAVVQNRRLQPYLCVISSVG
jgi:hypothetical protein